MAVTPSVTQVADGVHLAGTADVNWVIVTDGDAVTLIDAGYPAYADAVEQSLQTVGRRLGDVVAVLVTHAHIDHVGSLPTLLQRRRVPVMTSGAEVGHVRGSRHESAGPLDVVRNLWRPGVAPWALRISRAGAMAHVALPDAKPFVDDGPQDVPGRPVPVVTPGHTSGHTCYLLPQAGVLATGDALVTAHPTSRRSGPQLLLPMFQHDVAAAAASLAVIGAQPADVILPGHGPVHRSPIADAAAEAMLSAH